MSKSFMKPTTLNGALLVTSLYHDVISILKKNVYSVLVLEECITQIFPCTALTLNGLQKISHIPMPCYNEGPFTHPVGKSGDET